MSFLPRSASPFVPSSLGSGPGPTHPVASPRSRRRRRARRTAPLLGIALLGLTGCSSAVTVDAAPDAANPACAPAMVAMPDQVAGLAQRETTAQATTAWGDPERVVLKCGVQVRQPTSDPCVTVNGVDWTLRRDDGEDGSSPQPSASSSAASDSQKPGGTWSATTYGRTPAIRVTFDSDQVPSSTLLPQLQSAVQQIPASKKCQSAEDLEYHQ